MRYQDHEDTVDDDDAEDRVTFIVLDAVITVPFDVFSAFLDDDDWLDDADERVEQIIDGAVVFARIDDDDDGEDDQDQGQHLHADDGIVFPFTALDDDEYEDGDAGETAFLAPDEAPPLPFDVFAAVMDEDDADENDSEDDGDRQSWIEGTIAEIVEYIVRARRRGRR
jgi:hypothetical protein